jgi:hypothetical protein
MSHPAAFLIGQTFAPRLGPTVDLSDVRPSVLRMIDAARARAEAARPFTCAKRPEDQAAFERLRTRVFTDGPRAEVVARRLRSEDPASWTITNDDMAVIERWSRETAALLAMAADDDRPGCPPVADRQPAPVPPVAVTPPAPPPAPPSETPPGPRPVVPPQAPGPGCVRIAKRRSLFEDLSGLTEPWRRAKGWTVVETPTGEVWSAGTRSEFAVRDIWACPGPGAAPPPWFRPARVVVVLPPMVVVRPGAGPSGALPPDRVRVVLDAAVRAKAAVDAAMERGSLPDAGAADKAAAAAVAACLDQLSREVKSFDGVVAELRAAAATGRAARVTAREAAAVELFMRCADDAMAAARAEERKGGILDAIVGVGVPAAGALLVAL